MKIVNCQILCLLWAFLLMGCLGRAQVAAEKELDMNEQAELYLYNPQNETFRKNKTKRINLTFV